MDNPTTSSTEQQAMFFERLGNAFHLRIRDALDLAQVLHLDEAHWVATSAPVYTINCDPIFMGLLDNDADGRVRVDEVRAAVRWLLSHLQDHSGIRSGNCMLDPDAVRQEAPQGKAIRVALSKILARDRGAETSVTLEQIRKLIAGEEQGSLGLAGVILPDAAADADVRAFILDLIASYGGQAHPSGAEGVAADVLQRFKAEGRQLIAWHGLGRADGGHSAIMQFGADTPALFSTYARLKDKIDEFFSLCRMLRVDSLTGLQRETVPLAQPVERDQIEDYIAAAPLAAPNMEGRLDFDGPLNPHFADDLQQLRDGCLQAVLGKRPTTLNEPDWQRTKTAFAAYAQWRNARPDVAAATIPIERLHAYVTEPRYCDALDELVAQSHRMAFVLDNLRLVEKLILYQAYLIPFANSFVSFPDLYDPRSRATFEMGTLIMDGRHFTLSIRVPDRALHEKLCVDSNIFVLYVEVTGSGNPYLVAVPVTSGGRGMLQVDKWGIFQDVNGVEHHARVVHILKNPISMSEALVAPFRRLGSAISNKLEEITSKAQERFTSSGQETVGQIGSVLQTPAGKTAAAPTGGMLAGGGIAIAALGSSAAFITKTLSALSWQSVLAGILFILATVLVPTALSAWLKLHSRDLSNILEGSGWSINERMRLTRQQAITFTFHPPYGKGIRGLRLLTRRWLWPGVVFLAILGLLWVLRHVPFDGGSWFTPRP